jgi:hypothetical protein
MNNKIEPVKYAEYADVDEQKAIAGDSKSRKERVPPMEKELEDKIKAATDATIKAALIKQLKMMRFRRIAQYRLGKLENEMKLVGRLFTSANYVYTAEQAEYVLDIVEQWYQEHITDAIVPQTVVEEKSNINIPE